mmetsp:Transcript_3556/g.8976  ORF Transcript_3556/g.8976 Transcript_3556/m.8976 type:complete len:201 (-) Transcript_3556:314-916(-)
MVRIYQLPVFDHGGGALRPHRLHLGAPHPTLQPPAPPRAATAASVRSGEHVGVPPSSRSRATVRFEVQEACRCHRRRVHRVECGCDVHHGRGTARLHRLTPLHLAVWLQLSYSHRSHRGGASSCRAQRTSTEIRRRSGACARGICCRQSGSSGFCMTPHTHNPPQPSPARTTTARRHTRTCTPPPHNTLVRTTLSNARES